MQVINALDRMDIAPRQAILVHAPGSTMTGGRASTFATLHPVESEPGQRPVIGAGRVLGPAELELALGQLNPARQLAFLPATLLASSAAALVWWRPPAPARMWFHCADDADLRERTGVAPQPGLVFAALPGRHLFVWAVPGAARPEPATVLLRAPFMNVWEDGRVCTGNAALPRDVLATSMAGYEQGFWESRFTHPNVHGKNALVRWRGGSHAFAKAMLSGRYRAFPERALVPLRLTLADALKALAGGSAPKVRP